MHENLKAPDAVPSQWQIRNSDSVCARTAPVAVSEGGLKLVLEPSEPTSSDPKAA